MQQTSTTQPPAAQPQQPAAPPQPFVVKVIRPPEAAETTVGDVIFGSLGIAGVLLVIALLLGGVMAAIRVGWHRLRPPADDHLPPVSPLIADPTDPRSSQSR